MSKSPSEFFKNQLETTSFTEKKEQDKSKSLPAKKVLVLKLNPREQKALQYLGGPDALKKLLCPVGICISCRKNPVGEADLCLACEDSQTD